MICTLGVEEGEGQPWKPSRETQGTFEKGPEPARFTAAGGDHDFRKQKPLNDNRKDPEVSREVPLETRFNKM